MSTPDGEIVARGYDRVADQYEALEAIDSPWPRLERLRAFVAELPRGSDVLDLGCGNGVPATRELAKRHRVLGVDISPEQIARAKSGVPSARHLCCDVGHSICLSIRSTRSSRCTWSTTFRVRITQRCSRSSLGG